MACCSLCKKKRPRRAPSMSQQIFAEVRTTLARPWTPAIDHASCVCLSPECPNRLHNRTYWPQSFAWAFPSRSQQAKQAAATVLGAHSTCDQSTHHHPCCVAARSFNMQIQSVP